MSHFKLIASFSLTALFACAHTPPPPPQELVAARTSYEQAQSGPAARTAPAELHVAAEALQVAEESYRKEPKSQDTIDTAYIAERRAERANALGIWADAANATQRANKDLTKTQSAMLGEDQERLRAQKTQLEHAHEANDRARAETAQEHEARLAADQGRIAAEQKAKDAMDALSKSLQTKHDERGTIITLSGGVLFTTNQASILPGAQSALNQVADALKTQAERHFIVGGHTDDQGNDKINDDLSARRANAVRDYLVVHGVAANAITAQGFGSHQPIGDNKTVEGRAMNRRVEIIVQPDVTAQR
jgi:outer membrane protein OmpA-like peptidoglycan-associated protein